MKIIAVLVGIAFGWMLGAFLAFLIAGPSFGQLPLLTVPIGLAAGIAFALIPVLTTAKRIGIMVAATVLIVLVVK